MKFLLIFAKILTNNIYAYSITYVNFYILLTQKEVRYIS